MPSNTNANPVISDFSACHTGVVRSHNEDAVLSQSSQKLWAVADGMGGHDRGEYASQLVISSLLDMTRSPEAPLDTQMASIHRTLRQASQRLVDTAQQMSHGTIIGTTVVVAVLRDNQLACFWAGDSRAYRLRGTTLVQLTTDHTVANELIRDQGLQPEEANNVQGAEALTTAVGASLFAPQIIYDELHPGDRICLCSDGLNKMVPDSEIESVLNARQGAEAAVEQLLQLCLARHASDNVSIIVVDYE